MIYSVFCLHCFYFSFFSNFCTVFLCCWFNIGWTIPIKLIACGIDIPDFPDLIISENSSITSSSGRFLTAVIILCNCWISLLFNNLTPLFNQFIHQFIKMTPFFNNTTHLSLSTLIIWIDSKYKNQTIILSSQKRKKFHII